MVDKNIVKYIQENAPTFNNGTPAEDMIYDGDLNYSNGLQYSGQSGDGDDTILDGDLWYNTLNDNLYQYNKSTSIWDVLIESDPVPAPLGVDYAYLASGTIDGEYYATSIDRITFPFDSGTGILVGNLNNNIRRPAAFNSSNFGFTSGGDLKGGTTVSNVERCEFAFDSGTAVMTSTTSPSAYGAGSNSSIHGFVLGGHVEDLTAARSNIVRITFPFDSGYADHTGFLAHEKSLGTGLTSQWHAYSIGGWDNAGYKSYIDRIEYPFDSGNALLAGRLGHGERGCGSGCNSSSTGYYTGGVLATSQVEKISFPFGDGLSSSAGMLTKKSYSQGGANSTNYGYAISGAIDGGTHISSVDRLAFPFDSGSSIETGSISCTRYEGASFDGTDFVALFV